MEVQYSDFDEKYRDKLLALHEETFGQIEGSSQYIQQLTSHGKCVLAISDDRLAGYGLSAPIAHVPDKNEGTTHLEYINSMIRWSESDKLRSRLAGMLKELWKRNVEVTGFGIYQTEGEIDAQENDWQMSFLSVHKHFRLKGIGKQLVKARIDHARSAGAERVYALLHVAHEGIVRIYDQEHFQPIIQISNTYPDGSPARLVYKKL